MKGIPHGYAQIHYYTCYALILVQGLCAVWTTLSKYLWKRFFDNHTTHVDSPVVHHHTCCWFAANLLHFVCTTTPMTTHLFTRAVGRIDGCFRGWAPWCGQFPCRPGCQYERKDGGEPNARMRFDHISYIEMTMRNSSLPLNLNIMKFHVISVPILKSGVEWTTHKWIRQNLTLLGLS